MNSEVFAPVPHRQWVFTIPKRLRLFFRYDRSLLGKLCRAAWETVRDLYALEVDGTCGIPAMIGAIQIRAVYEVDPLKCPKHVVSLVEPCGGKMKIISFIEDDATIKKILKHCGKWKES